MIRTAVLIKQTHHEKNTFVILLSFPSFNNQFALGFFSHLQLVDCGIDVSSSGSRKSNGHLRSSLVGTRRNHALNHGLGIDRPRLQSAGLNIVFSEIKNTKKNNVFVLLAPLLRLPLHEQQHGARLPSSKQRKQNFFFKKNQSIVFFFFFCKPLVSTCLLSISALVLRASSPLPGASSSRLPLPREDPPVQTQIQQPKQLFPLFIFTFPKNWTPPCFFASVFIMRSSSLDSASLSSLPDATEEEVYTVVLTGVDRTTGVDV
jgi:hypothetical protein